MIQYPFCGFSDPVSSLSHFIGAFVCLCSSVPLWRSVKGHTGHRIAVGVFCFSCVFLLVMSGVYHLLPHGSSGRAVLQHLDHAAIFVLIAGTFTPMHSILFKGPWRWAPLVGIWLIAAAGITLKMIFFSQISEGLGITVYIIMGWLGIISGGLVWAQWGFSLVEPLIRGALVYSFGTLFEFFSAPTVLPGIVGPHELFHFAVLGGIAYHWKFVRKIVATVPLRIEQQLIPLPLLDRK